MTSLREKRGCKLIGSSRTGIPAHLLLLDAYDVALGSFLESLQYGYNEIERTVDILRTGIRLPSAEHQSVSLWLLASLMQSAEDESVTPELLRKITRELTWLCFAGASQYVKATAREFLAVVEPLSAPQLNEDVRTLARQGLFLLLKRRFNTRAR